MSEEKHEMKVMFSKTFDKNIETMAEALGVSKAKVLGALIPAGIAPGLQFKSEKDEYNGTLYLYTPEEWQDMITKNLQSQMELLQSHEQNEPSKPPSFVH